MCHCNGPFKLNLMLNGLDMMEADIGKLVYAVGSQKDEQQGKPESPVKS